MFQNALLPYEGEGQAADSAIQERDDDVPFRKLFSDDGTMEHAACR